MKMRRWVLTGCLIVWAAGRPLWAKENVVAVLSSDIQPFQVALASFQKSYGSSIPVIHLTAGSTRVEGEPRILMAFGGKAALAKLSDTSILVYCMAPGTHLRPADRSGQSSEISMMPPPELTLSKLQAMQPTLKRLAVLWASPSNELYADDIKKTARNSGIIVQAEQIKDTEGLPERLRALQKQTDALWIPSDPLLVNEANLILIAQFSESTHIPFYSSIGGLTKKGAVATISASYQDIGETAGHVVQKILSGSPVPPVVYVQSVAVVINSQAALNAGLDVKSIHSEGSNP